MPSRDPTTGKRVSGAGQRKRKYKQDQAPQEAKRRARASQAAPGAAPIADIVGEYTKCGPPPLDDTASLIKWGARMVGVSVWLTALDPDVPLLDKVRLVNDGCAKLGMIRDKASEQEKLDRAAKAFDTKRGKATKPSGGPKSLVGVAKPETARSGRGEPVAE